MGEQRANGVHFVGSSVNIPDMSASLQAKVKVSEDQQSDPAQLASVYDTMHARFLANGLNLAAVEATRQYFKNLDESDPSPLDYLEFPSPLPRGAVRLGVLFIRECCPELAQLLKAAGQDVAAALPEGTAFHRNDAEHFHVTVFMTSQPHTLRPDPFDREWIQPDVPPAEWASPGAATVQREVEAMRAAVAELPAPRFSVHRLLLADSGTLLLTSVEREGRTLTALRSRLRSSFPGAPQTQSTIIHMSIGRVLTPRQLDPVAVKSVAKVCDNWTTRLAGRTWSAAGVTHVQENIFTTVEGPTVFLPFQTNGQQN